MKTTTGASVNRWAGTALGITLATLALPGAAELTLVREGKPAASIVVATNATRAAQFAAYELQYHVQKITGAELPIVKDDAPVTGTRILVGDSQATRALGIQGQSIKSQEYLVRFAPETLVLVGKDKDDRGAVRYTQWPGQAEMDTWPDIWDEQGTMYATYDFLERYCGVRWFTPTEVGMDCPQTKTLTVKGRDIQREAFFSYRYAAGGAGSGEYYDAYTGLWLDGTDGFKAYEAAAYPEMHAQYPHGVAPFPKRGAVQLFLYRNRQGGEKSMCNHSLYHYYELFWAPSKDEACAKYFVRKRPELFAKGYPAESVPPQLCYTSPELIAQVAQEAREYFDNGGYPYKAALSCAPLGAKWGRNYFAIEPMDNGSFCKCAACQALIPPTNTNDTSALFSTGHHSDYFFNFVNEVAKEVKKTHPDKYIITLAYMSHAYPPKKIKLESNVAVQFCFSANRMPYNRADYENELKALRLWSEQGKERPISLYLYYCFPKLAAIGGKFNIFPGFFAHTLGKEFALFRDLGYRGAFHDGYGQEVEAYLTFRLMNDPTLDTKALLAEYFSRYYGAAAKPMQAFYEEVEKAYVNPANWPENPGHMNEQIAWGRLGTKARMDKLATLVDKARRLAKTDVEKKRLALFELSTWNYMLQGRASFEARTAAPIPSVTAPVVPAAGGDPAKVAWDKAAVLGGGWFDRGGNTPAARQLAGRLAHDGSYLYLELIDPCATKGLVAAPDVALYDDWELFVANQRGLPYRHFLVGPTGRIAAYLNGELNWRMGVPYTEHGIKIASDTSAPDKWVTRLAIPLKEAVPGGAKPGGKIYLNVARVSGGAITGAGLGIDMWVPYTTVHSVDRLAEVTLQ